MKYIILIFALLTINVLNAQNNQVWIFDRENPVNNQNDWRAPMWGLVHSEGVHLYPSPFYSYGSESFNVNF